MAALRRCVDSNVASLPPWRSGSEQESDILSPSLRVPLPDLPLQPKVSSREKFPLSQARIIPFFHTTPPSSGLSGEPVQGESAVK